ncbi:hypothetical protein COLO4_01061, partial [Corchorus olitorius]
AHGHRRAHALHGGPGTGGLGRGHAVRAGAGGCPGGRIWSRLRGGTRRGPPRLQHPGRPAGPGAQRLCRSGRRGADGGFQPAARPQQRRPVGQLQRGRRLCRAAARPGPARPARSQRQLHPGPRPQRGSARGRRRAHACRHRARTGSAGAGSLCRRPGLHRRPHGPAG